MANWKTVLTSGGTDLGQVDIKRGIFQGDSLIAIAVYIDHVSIDPSVKKDESWI